MTEDDTSKFDRIDSRTVYEGPIASVRIDTFRHGDGSEAERQVVTHPGAVAVVAWDDVHVWLVRQPREPVGEWTLELPAGKLDVPGESPIECARRELVEEVGLEASTWRELKRFYTSPGFAEEEVILYEATGLELIEHEPDPNERIEVVPWPLADLERAIEECADAKSVIGLLLFERERR
jgi:ADP-ribose pyrophosphatase